MTAITVENRLDLDDPKRAYAVLICDLLGLRFGKDGRPDISEIRAHIEAKGGVFHDCPITGIAELTKGLIHFFYQPHLSTRDELIEAAGNGRYDAVIAAATFLPAETVFPLGGVRIGAGTGNMGSASWGGGSGEGGGAPLMNTPGINSRATAQMVMKAILKVLPDLPVDKLHALVAAGDFDTGKDLQNFPTEKLEGKTIAVIGYGNIGREVAKLAHAFGMKVVIYARSRHRVRIEGEGFAYADTPGAAASGAHVLTVHVGLGNLNSDTKKFANAGLINSDVLDVMCDGSVVINYDRGEVLDITSLRRALASGKVRHAAIDADLFKNDETSELSGPMLPYLQLARNFPGQLELLPHAAADTDHVSRVAGAKQAVDQIVDVIRRKVVVNLRGTLPEGYKNGGAIVPTGIGSITPRRVLALFSQAGMVEELAELSELNARLWLQAIKVPTKERQAFVDLQGKQLISLLNKLCLFAEENSLRGYYE
ncbi:NAD(P)-dependent oxidoreductase [Phyllobacterium chamaecytisi]|uniref:NAD(P)-dependent oxidoreductase n=1 Tax=Phyllobacterium chamaecytisi TaxID=2876082 RepID=UPI00351D0A31